MAKFGLDIYGAPAYGEAEIRAFAANPRAQCLYYDHVEVTWNAPNGVWTQMRLVRNPHGEPFSSTDGVLLLDVDRSGQTSYTDQDVVSGRRYYYGVFVLNAEEVWVTAGSTSVLVVRDYDYLGTLWNRLPQIYKTTDFSELTGEDDIGVPMLVRFLSLFAYELDATRSEYDGLLDLLDPAKTPSIALPALLAQFGLELEPALGSRSARQLAANAPYLFATKGTTASLENVVQILTGWDCYYRMGINRVLDPGDTLATLEIGRWDTALTNCVVLAQANQQFGVSADIGSGYMALVPVSNGLAQASTSAPGDSGRLNSMYVIPARAYVSTIRVRGTGTVRLDLDFYDRRGQLLDSFTGDENAADPDEWTVLNCAAEAPANSVYAAMRVVVLDGIDGQPVYFNAAQFADAPGGDWQEPRQAQLVVNADRVNEIWNPASQGVSTYGWSSDGQLISGAPGLVFIWTGADQAEAMDYREVTAEPVVRVSPGEQWSVTVRAMSGDDIDACVYLRLFSAEVEMDPVHLDEADFERLVGDDWTTLSFTYTVPADGSVTGIQAAVAFTRLDMADTAPLAAGDQAQFRDAALMRGSSTEFFDGSFRSITADFLWEGEPFQSRSHLYINRAIKQQRALAMLPKFLPLGMTATLVFAVPRVGVYGVHTGVENFNLNPGLAPRVEVDFDFTLAWRRPITWDEVKAAHPTWDDVKADFVSWDDVTND